MMILKGRVKLIPKKILHMEKEEVIQSIPKKEKD